MKLAGALCLLFVALAAPTAPPRTTDADLPPETPVNIQGLDPDFDMKCGKSFDPIIECPLTPARQGYGERD